MDVRVGVDFDAMRGPASIAHGDTGIVRIAGMRAGSLTTWRVVISPATQLPTLIGEGRFLRYYQGALGCKVRADVVPRKAHAYIGRPKPPTPRPFAIEGTLHELSTGTIVISYGTIVRG